MEHNGWASLYSSCVALDNHAVRDWHRQRDLRERLLRNYSFKWVQCAFRFILTVFPTGSGPHARFEFEIAAAQGQILSQFDWPNPAARDICGVMET
jgi:hypothetical protein